MTPSAFSYARAGSLNEALELLAEHRDHARVLAGGQSLIPLLAQRALRPRVVIDINRIAGLDLIELESDHVRMGALVRQEQARLSEVVRTEVSGLSEALAWVASPVIRERGTVVGNLVANAPGSELPAVAAALGARFIVHDRAQERMVEAAELACEGLAPDALVTHVLWPRCAGRGAFYEVARRDGHVPVVGAVVNINRAGCRIGLCGVTAAAIACPTVAQAVLPRFPSVPGLREIDELLARDLRAPLYGNAFVGSDYRREIAPAVIQRAIMAAGRRPVELAGARH